MIDADYRGEVKVILLNHETEDYQFKAGDRIAQLIVEKIQLKEAMEVDELDKTEREIKGFGVRHTKHPRRNNYSDEALLAIHTVVAHFHTKEEALAPAM